MHCFEYIFAVRYYHQQILSNFNLSQFTIIKENNKNSINCECESFTGSHQQQGTHLNNVEDRLRDLPDAVGVCSWTSHSDQPLTQQDYLEKGLPRRTLIGWSGTRISAFLGH